MSNKTMDLLKEMDSVNFAKELDKLEGKYITINVEGEISTLYSIESFNYSILEGKVIVEDWLVIEDDNAPDEYILRICLETVAAYQKDLISDALILVTDGGMVIQFQEC
ncbi:hypothetical protein HMPREF1982_03530 [Clostridiales bacterium oral taxon 876 str. F0540]|nr:hypothetical protein HMPREF1982_03530 [Clostridiales bacterium oral taxon 876 str. F0540]